MHAVVFTRSLKMHEAVVTMLRPMGFVICELRGSTTSDKRDAAIRNFQAGMGGGPSAKATVLVVTMKTGAVGVTLTAASRGYLMEPQLDPSLEVQAAGRIHRLGQTKDGESEVEVEGEGNRG